MFQYNPRGYTTNARFLFTFVFIIPCVPCFAEDMPAVPELIKKMYDYRMVIENMLAKVTVKRPIDEQLYFPKNPCG